MNSINKINLKNDLKFVNFLALINILLLFGCSSSDESLRQSQIKEPEISVFQEAAKQDSSKIITKAQEIKNKIKTEKDSLKIPSRQLKFYIQLGVFTSKERADAFIKDAQPKSPYLMNITQREIDKKFVVRLKPFSTREEAESVKKNIKQISEFKDAFIVSEE